MSRHLLLLSASATLLMLAWPARAQEAPAPEQKPVVLDPLTVTGTKVPTPQSEVPATIDVITQEDLERQQPMTIGDALDNLPGVEVEGGPKGSQAQPNIRGFGGTGWGTNRVVTTLDGARQDVGAAHGGSMFYEPELIKQVEVLKGTGSTLYGSGAIGGVIALTTKDAADFLEGGQFRRLPQLRQCRIQRFEGAVGERRVDHPVTLRADELDVFARSTA